MTTPARQQEADAIELAYHAALIQLGLQALEDAGILWADVPPTGVAAGSSWLRTSLRYIQLRRQRARALAIAKYRLVRALRTGSTIAEPGVDTTSSTTLGQLVDDFERLAGVPVKTAVPATTSIPVEPVAISPSDADRLERDAQDEAALVLDALGPRGLAKRLSQLDLEAPAESVDAQRGDAHQASGRRQAAAVERLVLNGARSTTWAMTEKDPRAVGYVRFSTTGTPCGWCAMLISRKALYKTSTGAAGKTRFAKTVRSGEYAEGDLYHDNCKCDVMPVFSYSQFNNSELFAINRDYAALWPDVTKGLKGKAAVSAWRAFIRAQHTGAPEAPPTTSVQEA